MIQMKDILSIIRLKNPEDVTQKELDAFRLVIEEAQQHFDKLQTIHRELTGRNYVPPIRLANNPRNPTQKGLEGTKIDDGSHRMSDGFYESEFGRNNYR